MRLAFFTVIGLWLVFPILVRANMAQDAVPYVVAGEFTVDHPESVYPARSGDLYDIDPAFAKRSCEVAPPGSDCTLNVAFVATPLAIPIAVAVARLGADGGVLLMRLLGALSLSAGMWILWNALAHRTPRAAALLVATAVLLTPFAVAPIALGQTSELLFLSVCLGVTSARKGQNVLASGVWVATIALKAFPAALIVLLVWQRRWRMLAWSAAWSASLALLAFAAGPASLWTDFVKSSGRLAGQSNWNVYNGSLEALVHSFAPAITDNAVSGSVLKVGVAALAAGALWWIGRRAGDDTQFAFGSLLLLLVVPFVWWHYMWVVLGAIGIALSGREHLDDRTVAVLPIVAAVTIPFSILNAQGRPAPAVQALFLLTASAVTAALSPSAAPTHPVNLEI